MEVLYKVELFEKINGDSRDFKENELYPVRVVRRGDKRILENFNGVQVNVGWDDMYSMSSSVEWEKAEFAKNFKLTREVHFHNYKAYIKWYSRQKCEPVNSK